jgi:hypothetical protein
MESKMIYRFKASSYLHGDAQAVGERLEQLRQRDSGVLPEAMVADAESDSSPLHPFFEWDNSVAAQKHRETQARELIRSLDIEYESTAKQSDMDIKVEASPERRVRAFVSIQRSDGVRVYEPTLAAMADEGMKRQVLSQAYSELSAVSRKYRDLNELAQVVTAIELVGERLREPIAA